MSARHKLSLKAAIFTNINIMAGAGIFINTVILTKTTGIIGSFAYLLIGLFMLPLISSIAELVKMHPSGGFYAFAQPVSPFLGFISCWTYFFSKLASTSLVLYVSAVFLKQLFPSIFAMIPIIPLSMILLALFTYLNLFNLEVGSFIQKIFFTAKSIPALFVICLGLWKLNADSLYIQSSDFINISTAIPLVLYCLAGFESACSLSRKIKDPKVNGPKAIFYSFFILVGVFTIFQFLASIMLQPNISQMSSYQDAFPYLTTLINIPAWLQQQLASLLSLCIVTSTLGGAYGMLFANPWNLYTLAEHNHIFASDTILKLNKHEIPTAAIIIEAVICFIFLLTTHGNQVPLQQTAALGATIAYTISVIALLKQASVKSRSLLALITCTGFIISCIISSIAHSITSLALFCIMLSFGIIMFACNKKSANS